MRVLITGAHGFIGQYLAKIYAASGFLVYGIGHGHWVQDDLVRLGFECWHTADITIDSLVTYGGDPDIIVHCAGSGSVPFSVAHPYQDFARTVNATATVLEYMRIYCPNAILIYPSSAAVYGSVDTLPIVESIELRPTSPYGAHKVMAEQICHSYASQYNLAVVIVRLFSIYGEGLKKQLLWDACCKMAKGNFIFFGTGNELRDWLHIEDAARLLMLSSSLASTKCPVFNGGSGVGVTVRDVLAHLMQNLGYFEPLVFSGLAKTGDPPGMQADMSRLARLDWSPQIDLREGMQRYVDWFKEECQ